MSYTLTTIQNVQFLVCSPNGGKLKSERDALDVINETFNEDITWVLIPVEQLTEEFFNLQTGIAGSILQKFVQYRRRLVIMGDISHYIEQSRSFNSLVYEMNKGKQVWFLTNQQELTERLKSMQ